MGSYAQGGNVTRGKGTLYEYLLLIGLEFTVVLEHNLRLSQ